MSRNTIVVIFSLMVAVISACNQPMYQGKTVKQWKTQLRDSSPGMREQAIQALGAIAVEDKSVLQTLYPYMSDESESVRIAVGNELQKLAVQYPEINKFLVACLEDPDQKKAEAAALVLQRLTAENSSLAQMIGEVAARSSGGTFTRAVSILTRAFVQQQPPQSFSFDDKVIINSLGMVFTKIPAGEFMMGSPKQESCRHDNERQHKVQITKPFMMMTTEVTQRQWQAIMGANPSHFKESGTDCPVETISWYDTVIFCNILSEKEGLTPCYSGIEANITCNFAATGYRLPTEAEWEYACRASSTGLYYTGNDISDCYPDATSKALDLAGWYYKNSDRKTHPVALKQCNLFGLFDMHGNVREWCWDWYGDYPSGLVVDPSGLSTGSSRVLRGGSWDSDAQYCRSALRVRNAPDYRNYFLGFRLSRFVSLGS